MSFSSALNLGGLRSGICTSTSKPASPFDGQIIYMTDVDQSAVWDGSAWVGMDPSRDRNVLINGAMQIAQRGTSTASITVANYYTVDRWSIDPTGVGVWTMSVENDAPTGSGFRKSVKLLCTTADTPTASEYVLLAQTLEGQNVQGFAKGTASAKQFALSFWVKSNVTGTYIARLNDTDNSRAVSASYTISASATWEKKTIIFPADTTGEFANDNGSSLQLQLLLSAGSSFNSSPLQTTWNGSGTLAFGQTNLASATNNYWQVTGVQLEVGAVATPFEFEDIGTTLAKCQRYYWRAGGDAVYQRYGLGIGSSSTLAYASVHLPVFMRAAPSSVTYNQLNSFDGGSGPAIITSVSINAAGKNCVDLSLGAASGFVQHRPLFLHANNSLDSYLAFSAEL